MDPEFKKRLDHVLTEVYGMLFVAQSGLLENLPPQNIDELRKRVGELITAAKWE